MKRKADFLLQKVGGEHLLVPLGAQVMDLNGLITLNETAASIWEMLAEERRVDELAAVVEAQFEVDAATARADVETFVAQIRQLGLLET
jgi:hypothetical protein